MNVRIPLTAFAALAAFTASNANAATLVASTEPTGSFQAGWSNKATAQNFMVKFTLPTKTIIDTAQIWLMNGYGSVGQSVTIRFRTDDAGSPAASNLFSFTDTVDAITPFSSNTRIATSNFTPVALEAGSYWFGMSGTTTELSWASYNNGIVAPLTQRYFIGDNVISTPSIGSLTFRLYSPQVPAIPEPGTWLLALAGFGFMGASMRQGHKVTLRYV